MTKKLSILGLWLLFSAFLPGVPTVFVKEAGAASSLPPLPAGLKPYFMIGLGNNADHLDWMAASGVSWNARYQYLAGGVNTGTGWSNWNSPAGAFASNYMEESAKKGFMPVFTYYMLLQSKPAEGANELDRDFNNLKNPATMRAYYADFKLLMDRAAQFGRTVIVQIEPDLWGFLEKRSSNPNSQPAAVSSSGFAEASGYPDTVSGFALTLVNLRDRYAPNVLLAYHISPWASNYGDLSTSHDQGFNLEGAAAEIANYYLQTRANFDLLFYDIADRDAALYQSWGDPNHWWDTANLSYPNFKRFEAFAARITALTGKRGILWQVPVGNTLYRSLNNTNHHWQDNRVQYYLGDTSYSHLKDLANSGIAGIFFGAGDGSATVYDDSAGDGITNPLPVNGNRLESVFADDDGGYLRLTASAYFASGGVLLPEASPALTGPASYNKVQILSGDPDPAFGAVWRRTDDPVIKNLAARSWMWGSQPNGLALMAEAYDGKARIVQYHDKARMEINDPNGDRSSLFFVTNGLLVTEMVSGQVQLGENSFATKEPASIPVAGDPNSSGQNPAAPTYASFGGLASLNNNRASPDRTGRIVSAFLSRDGSTRELAGVPASIRLAYFEPNLKHNIPDVFWRFMNSRGMVLGSGGYGEDIVVNWVYALGYPLSEPFWTRAVVSGVEKDVLVQPFQRRVLTFTPSNDAGFQVEMGNAGLHYYSWRYGQPFRYSQN